MKKNRSVMEDRAPAEVIADTAQRKRWRELDYFASPPWSVRAGLEVIRHPYIDDCFGGLGTVWEPACGDGVMAKVLADDLGGTNVVASDIEPQGYGQQHDFLCDQPIGGVRWIVTNPPFANAADFVNRGLGIAKVGVAILCRLAFLESVARYDLNTRHLTDVAIFSERVPMQPGTVEPGMLDGDGLRLVLLFQDRGDGISQAAPDPARNARAADKAGRCSALLQAKGRRAALTTTCCGWSQIIVPDAVRVQRPIHRLARHDRFLTLRNSATRRNAHGVGATVPADAAPAGSGASKPSDTRLGGGFIGRNPP